MNSAEQYHFHNYAKQQCFVNFGLPFLSLERVKLETTTCRKPSYDDDEH